MIKQMCVLYSHVGQHLLGLQQCMVGLSSAEVTTTAALQNRFGLIGS